MGIRRTWALFLVLMVAVVVAAPVAAEEAGTETGEVVFRVTLSGPVDPADAFYVLTHCPGASCQPADIPGVTWPDPYERSVVACGEGLADQVTCTATTYEWTMEVEPGPLHYRFFRIRDVLGDQEELLQASGAWQVHSGRQVLSFGYVYPAAPEPTLPDTAVSAP